MKIFRTFLLFFLLTVVLGCASVSRGPSSNAKAVDEGLPPIAFMTDFGTVDDSVGICKGVMLSIDPRLKIVDITHQVPTFSVKDAARFLANTTPFFPAGTVFLVVVERHGKGLRHPIIAKSSRGQYFVLPNNGVLTLVDERDKIVEAREVLPGAWTPNLGATATFTARDLYAPIAAHVARGEDWSHVGPKIETVVHIDMRDLKVGTKEIVGEVVALDGPFGNLITSITATSLLNAGYTLGDKVPVKIGKRLFNLPFVKTFDDVPVNDNLLYIDSTDHAAIAINQGNFASHYKIKPPVPLAIVKKAKHEAHE